MTALILKVAPKSFTCEGEPSAECRTATQVAVAVTNAFREYRISDPGEIAALISLQAFESVNFRYNRNHGPGLPGQGTAAMLIPDLISKYAASIPAIAGTINGLSPEALLDLINANDDYNFGSAAWQLDTQCGSGVRINLHTIGRPSWEAWIKYCVGATIPPERVAYWHRACIAVADHFHLVEAKGKDKVPAFCS
ncbi:MAG: hypothetical protein M1835_000718 [Candelina submexicana]|nr:MAG: hypothetical protein M1835_000718 [Candelina submexicana]